MANNTSEVISPKTGYDLEITGLDDGSFYSLHIIAIASLSVSVVCALITMVISCIMKRSQRFFTEWQKRDRFVIYMAICDGLYGVCHLADHVNVFVVKDHVYPKILCVFYSFIVFTMMIAQNLLVNAIAINAFGLLFFEKKLNFGRWDWRLHAWMFGPPIICAVVSTALDKYGPNGAFCLFDGVTGGTFYMTMVSIPIIVILPTTAFLYVLIYAKLYVQTQSIKRSLGSMSAGMKASHKAARSMTLFIVAYIIQWWVPLLYGFWAAVNDSVPQLVVQFIVFFANLGGLLNLVVFIIIQRTADTPAANRSQNGHSTRANTCVNNKQATQNNETGNDSGVFSISGNASTTHNNEDGHDNEAFSISDNAPVTYNNEIGQDDGPFSISDNAPTSHSN